MTDGRTVVTGGAVEASTVITFLFSTSLANEVVNEFLTVSISPILYSFCFFPFQLNKEKQTDIWMMIG